MAQETIGDLVIQLSANVNRLQADLAQANRVASQGAEQMERAFKSVGSNIAAGLTAALAAVNFTQLIKGSIDAADKIQDLANRSGAGVKGLSELKFAAEQSGTSFETLSKGLQTVAKNAAGAAGGNADLAAAFKAAGVEIQNTSGSLKGADELLAGVAERFSELQDGPEKTALALKLFGKAGAELVPLLNEGKDGLAAFAAEADRLGVSLDANTAAAAAAFNDQFDKVKSAVQGAGLELAKTLLPALQAGAEALTEFLVAARESGALGKLAEGIKFVLSNLDDLAVGIATFIGARGIAGFVASIAAGTTSLVTFGVAIKAAGAAMLAFAASPAGIALAVAGVAVALYKFGDAADDLSNRLANSIATLEQFKGKLGQLRGAQVQAIAEDYAAAVAKLLDVENRMKAVAARGVAITDGRVSNSGAKELQELREQATALREQIAQLQPGLEQINKTTFDRLISTFSQASGGLQQILKNAQEVARELQGTKIQSPEFDELTSKLDGLRNKYIQAGGSAEKFAELTKPAASIVDTLTKSCFEAAKAAEKFAIALDPQAFGRFAQDMADIDRATKDAAAAIAAAFDSLIAAQERDIQVLQVSGAEREDLIRLFGAQEQVARTLGRSWSELTEEEKKNNADKVNQVRLREREKDLLLEQDRVLQEFTRSLEQMGEVAIEAFADLATGISDFGGFFDNLGNSSSRFFSDLLSQALKAKDVLATLGESLNKASAFGPGGQGLNLQTAGNILGAGANAFQSFRQGDTVGTITGTAQLGASIAGLPGAIVGGIVGAIASIFGGSKPPDLRLGGIGVTRKPEQTFTTALGNFQVGARGLEGGEADFIKLVEQFDASIAGIVRSFEDGQAQLTTVQAALQRFSLDLKGDAVTAENVLGARFGAILGTFSADIQAFVGTVGTVAERVQRLSDASVIEQTVGTGLFDTFAQAADVLTDLQIGTEAIGATYLRVAGSVDLLDDTLAGLGLSTSRTREDFIRFAAGLAESLGGLNEAAGIIGRNLTAFLSPEEQAAVRRRSASSNLASAAVAAGIGEQLSNDDFRTLLNQALAGAFDPARTAAILRYGDALATFNAVMTEGTQAVTAAIAPTAIGVLSNEEAAAARSTARQTLAQLLAGLGDAVADFGRTDYDRQIEAFRRGFAETQQALIDAAAAAGEAGPPLAGIADAITLLQLQTEEALAGLRRSVLRDLINLYPSEPITFTSELDLFTRGLRNAGDQTAAWAAELQRLEKLDAATSLARNIRSLFEGSGQSITEGLAGLFGSSGTLNRILGDLGVSFADFFSDKNLDAFSRAAKLFGLSFDQLAELNGIDLSSLDPTRRAALNAASAQDAPKIVDTKDPETTQAVDNLAKDARDGLTAVRDEVRVLGSKLDRLTDELVRARTSPAGLPA